jgi:hypothetical protein
MPDPVLLLRYAGFGLLFAGAVGQSWPVALGGLILLAYSWIARWLAQRVHGSATVTL